MARADRSITASFNDNRDRTRAEILSSFPIRKESTREKRIVQDELLECILLPMTLINELPGNRMSPDTFSRGMFFARTPSPTHNLFRQLIRKNEEVSRPLSRARNQYDRNRWSSNTVNSLMSSLDRVKEETKDARA